MSEPFVPDASVAVAWAIPSQATAATDRLLDDVCAGRSLVVPALWPFEVANALMVLKRRKVLESAQLVRSMRSLSLLSPSIDEEGPRLALSAIAVLADKHGLSLYDASYLELALRLGLPLASRDSALNHRAKLCGVLTLV